MAKITQQQWDKAKVLIEAGENISFAAKSAGIERSTLSKKSKSEGWESGKNHSVIVDEVRLAVEKSHLNSQELEHHDKEVAKRLKAEKLDDFLDGGSGIAAKAAVDLMQKPEVSMQELAMFGKLQNDLRVGIGTQQKFANAPQINNTNAQQNKTITIIKAEETLV